MIDELFMNAYVDKYDVIWCCLWLMNYLWMHMLIIMMLFMVDDLWYECIRWWIIVVKYHGYDWWFM